MGGSAGREITCESSEIWFQVLSGHFGLVGTSAKADTGHRFSFWHENREESLNDRKSGPGRTHLARIKAAGTTERQAPYRGRITQYDGDRFHWERIAPAANSGAICAEMRLETTWHRRTSGWDDDIYLMKTISLTYDARLSLTTSKRNKKSNITPNGNRILQDLGSTCTLTYPRNHIIAFWVAAGLSRRPYEPDGYTDKSSYHLTHRPCAQPISTKLKSALLQRVVISPSLPLLPSHTFSPTPGSRENYGPFIPDYGDSIWFPPTRPRLRLELQPNPAAITPIDAIPTPAFCTSTTTTVCTPAPQISFQQHGTLTLVLDRLSFGVQDVTHYGAPWPLISLPNVPPDRKNVNIGVDCDTQALDPRIQAQTMVHLRRQSSILEDGFTSYPVPVLRTGVQLGVEPNAGLTSPTLVLKYVGYIGEVWCQSRKEGPTQLTKTRRTFVNIGTSTDWISTRFLQGCTVKTNSEELDIRTPKLWSFKQNVRGMHILQFGFGFQLLGFQGTYEDFDSRFKLPEIGALN
ncbi:hypothetical protein C8R43DRAFT_1108722, partial [Mycena crocata]